MNNRNFSIDLLRLVCTFGVVALHVPSGTPESNILNLIFWPVCVPFFYVASLAFFISGLKKIGKDNFFKSWSRLVLPYLIWSAVYMSLLIVNHFLFKKGDTVVWWRALFYGESAVHLYFVPTLILLQSFVLGIFFLFKEDKKDKYLAIFTLFLAGVYFGVGVYFNCYGIRTIGSLIGICLFIGTAFWIEPKMHNPLKSQERWMITLAGLILLISALVCNFSSELLIVAGYSVIYPLGGIGIFLIAVANPVTQLNRRVIAFTGLSYGIYLCHIVFLEAYEIFSAKILTRSGIHTLQSKLLEVVIVFIVSACFVSLIKRIAVLRRLMLGEK